MNAIERLRQRFTPCHVETFAHPSGDKWCQIWMGTVLVAEVGKLGVDCDAEAKAALIVDSMNRIEAVERERDRLEAYTRELITASDTTAAYIEAQIEAGTLFSNLNYPRGSSTSAGDHAKQLRDLLSRKKEVGL
ncbi:hypothetical protein LCGC14_1326080 [marine sediment metagenome]|uniref:Uncharacterized protein n=1 Tax=marine sediment metagenome TaxID=412755 RepID=A0A0F9NKF1_9ZZZZ